MGPARVDEEEIDREPFERERVVTALVATL
jgi:hypothetical protein